MGDVLGDGCGQAAEQAAAAPTPEPVSNRPALTQVSYRAGRYATFLASMRAALSAGGDSTLAPLAALRTRDPADFTVALLDAWAVVLDILTFYSERVANEGFLRTAAEQRSAAELAALVGYLPSPGVSATATLAFTLSSAVGAPAAVPVPAGTRVQSVPGPGQSPQVFETSAALTARAAWNALPAQVTTPWSLDGTERSTWLAGTANNLSAGDALLFVAASGGGPDTAGGPAELHFVTAVAPDPAANATQVTWEAPLQSPQFGQAGACLYVLRTKAALFGAAAPSPVTPSYQPWGSGQVRLDTSYPGLVPGSDDAPRWLALTMTSDPPVTYGSVFTVSSVQDVNPRTYGLTFRATALTVGRPLALGGLPQTPDSDTSADGLLASYLKQTPDVTAYVRSEQLTGAPLPLAGWGSGWPQPGAPGMLVPVGGTAVSVTGGHDIPPGQPAALSGRRVRLQAAAGGTFTPAGASAGAPVPGGQVFLLDTVPPAVDAASNVSWAVITTSGVSGSLTHPASSPWPALLPAAATDPPASEAIVIASATPAGDITTLILTAPLSRVYDRPTVTVNANAVLATHGQTVQEILGSGDASRASLSFTLKQAPLAYVTAPVTSGAQSTLEVWVNNLRWQEVPSLLTAGPADRVYTVSADPSGHAVVQFGDGTAGSRPPTGQANIRAVYRTGTGLAGMAGAGQISQPLDRPQGVSSVSNPSPASGAADPATADDLRASAPLPTLALGRVVSLQDYQDYALSFAGIAKALAAYSWSGGTRGVFLTVAGTGGTALTLTDPVLSSLVTALRQAGDPHLPLTVVPHVPALFTFTASIAADTSAYDPPAVLLQAWQAVSAAFAVGQRGLGQPVAASQLIEVIQQVPGVLAVRLTGLMRSGQPATAAAVLRASGPCPPLGAELLLLDPAAQGQLGIWS